MQNEKKVFQAPNCLKIKSVTTSSVSATVMEDASQKSEMEEIQNNSLKHDVADATADLKSIKLKSNNEDSSDYSDGNTGSSPRTTSFLTSPDKNVVNGNEHLNNTRDDENGNESINRVKPLHLNSVSSEINPENSIAEESEEDEASDESEVSVSYNNDERSSGEESDMEDNTDLEGEVELLSQNQPNPTCSFPLRQRQQNPVLPETVTVLETSEGCKVYLVGTAHFSLESQEDVATTIQATQPDIVMVELCNSRVNILALDEKTILEEAKNINFEKMQIAIKQNGFLQGVMYLLLLSMSAHITKQLGMAPGGEFRRAFTEARKVPGCLVHLGDRPIQITLKRALSALPCWQKMRLAWYMITNKQPISKEEIERCKRRDLLEELLAEMTGEFPALSAVFVQERDTFLAYSLRLAATPVQSPNVTNGVIPTVVVGVVGIGHVSGIVENWSKVTEAHIPPILSIPEPSTTSKVIRKTIRYSLLGVALWGCCRLLAPRIGLNISPKQWLNGFLQR